MRLRSWRRSSSSFCRDRGRLDELVAAVEAYMEANEILTWRAGLTIALAAAGEIERVRRSFEVSMAEDLAALPRDMWWVATVALVAEGCASLGDAERVRRYAGSWALIIRT